MKILAVYPYTHLSSSALAIDGAIVAASPEERFNREKMSTKFPIQSAQWCLQSHGLTWDDLDLIVVPWNPALNMNDASGRWVSEMRWRGEMIPNVAIQVMRAMQQPAASDLELKWRRTRIVFLNHHECHAANGFYQSPFEKADILNIDGHGEIETCFLGSGDGARITRHHSINYPHSVGLFYGTFTDFLGFTPDVDEWKVMALSSYAEQKNEFDEKIRSLVALTEHGFELDLTYFDFYTFDRRPTFYSPKLVQFIGPPRKRNADLIDRHYAIAGAMQRVFTEVVTHLLQLTRQRGPGNRAVVLGGGAAMNCVLNGQLDRMETYADSYISSSPDDSGVSVGAALLAHYRYGNRAVRTVQTAKHNYWGPAYADGAIAEILHKFKITAEEPADLLGDVARALADGKLIGWFQGHMEFGHRALGNRSILADPRHPETKDKVNLAVKYRENFRPFAPAVLEDKAEEIFDIRPGRRVRFMERAVLIRKDWQPRLGAVAHVDGTGRLQTVEREANPKFYDLIQAFFKITGVPVLLNTSFNLNGEPIVMKPEDAIRTFYSCGLDWLVLGSFLIKKTSL